MKLYNSYCYTDIQAVADSIQSSPILGDGTFISSVTVNLDTIVINKSTGQNFNFIPPDCDFLGFDNSFMGLTVPDSLELAWLSEGVLASAYVIKILRRGL